MAKQNVKLAKDEKLVKRYDCFKGQDKKFLSRSRRDASILVTTSRLIYSEKNIKDLGNTAYKNAEILIKDIKSFNTSYEKDLPIIRIILMIFFGLTFFLSGVTVGLGATFTVISVILGLALIGLAA